MKFQAAFKKTQIFTEPILKYPKPEKLVIIQTDTSALTVGIILLQKDQEGCLKPCTYISKKIVQIQVQMDGLGKRGFYSEVDTTHMEMLPRCQ